MQSSLHIVSDVWTTSCLPQSDFLESGEPTDQLLISPAIKWGQEGGELQLCSLTGRLASPLMAKLSTLL